MSYFYIVTHCFLQKIGEEKALFKMILESMANTFEKRPMEGAFRSIRPLACCFIKMILAF